MTLSLIKQSIRQEPLKINHIYLGDCLEVLKGFPDESVNCCVTSPPYWGLRDYGVDGQAGLEKTPEEFVQRMVEIFREVRRVLKSDGTLWLNLGDSYAANRGYQVPDSKHVDVGNSKGMKAAEFGLKPKDLVGIPWMVAFALRADGWYLRQDIIWHKPNPMPESVRDRCTKAHEYIFLMTKSARYYYDQEAIKEDAVAEGETRKFNTAKKSGRCVNVRPSGNEHPGALPVLISGRNKRSVWTVTTQPFSEAHFATYPEKLIEPCILAGCPEWVCAKCGKARERIVENNNLNKQEIGGKNQKCMEAGDRNDGNLRMGDIQSKTIGWTTCACNAGYRPGIVLDPFMGAGTTGLVAYKNKRDYIGIELNPEYREMAIRRIQKEQEKYGLLEGIA